MEEADHSASFSNKQFYVQKKSMTHVSSHLYSSILVSKQQLMKIINVLNHHTKLKKTPIRDKEPCNTTNSSSDASTVALSLIMQAHFFKHNKQYY